MKCKKTSKEGHCFFEIETEINETEKTCTISTDTTAVHEVDVVSYKPDRVYVDVEVESLNGCVEFVGTDETSDGKIEQVLPPARQNNPAKKTFKFRVRRRPDAADDQDTLKVSIRYYTHRNATTERKNTTAPDLYPEVDLV